ncbi:MAG TPA: response regulator [Candidatus Polarisedimenticolaceae bacterium]|nr:response regulator [Candidatus Polarisedimenticolaceae bacterium]
MEPKPIALVIEDNEDLNSIFTSALEKAGYIVQSVYDGAAAMEILSEIVPSIITLDLHMPGMSGDMVLKHIRNDVRLKGVRVIVATADARSADAMQFQPELVLLKPISFSQLSDLASRFAPKQAPIAPASEN